MTRTTCVLITRSHCVQAQYNYWQMLDTKTTTGLYRFQLAECEQSFLQLAVGTAMRAKINQTYSVERHRQQ